MNKKYDVYLASPLFCDKDNYQLDIMENWMDELCITYFSPRKDSNVVGDLRSAKTPEEKDAIAQQIYELNINAVESSRLVLANVKGVRHDNATYVDQGTMIEIGHALAVNIPVVTFNFEDFPVNIMISQKVVHHLQHIDEMSDNPLILVDDVLDDIKSGMNSVELRKKYFHFIKELV